MKPSTYGARVLVSAWLLFVVIIVAVYTANLTAAFTVRPGVRPFHSLRELLDNHKYKIGIFPGGITSMILRVHLQKIFFIFSVDIKRALS